MSNFDVLSPKNHITTHRMGFCVIRWLQEGCDQSQIQLHSWRIAGIWSDSKLLKQTCWITRISNTVDDNFWSKRRSEYAKAKGLHQLITNSSLPGVGVQKRGLTSTIRYGNLLHCPNSDRSSHQQRKNLGHTRLRGWNLWQTKTKMQRSHISPNKAWYFGQ